MVKIDADGFLTITDRGKRFAEVPAWLDDKPAVSFVERATAFSAFSIKECE